MFYMISIVYKKLYYNIHFQNGSTALHLACCVHNFVRIAYLLLRAGARVNEVITEKVHDIYYIMVQHICMYVCMYVYRKITLSLHGCRI